MSGRYTSFLPAGAIARILVPRIGWCSLLCTLFWLTAQAAGLDGMQLPDTLQVDGKTLHLNGFGPRTYSLLHIHIYVAGLYLEHLSTDPDEIMASPETKLLNVRFEHYVSAGNARKAWREGLQKNCRAPCHLDPGDVARFLAAVPAMHAGDSYSMLFTQNGASVTVNGHQVGIVPQPLFAEAMLATFLGPAPASERLKRELLRGHG
jgi:hypothetical protein